MAFRIDSLKGMSTKAIPINKSKMIVKYDIETWCRFFSTYKPKNKNNKTEYLGNSYKKVPPVILNITSEPTT
ncbi:hypothetical protein GCM10007963_20100 [Lutibacter litoralis]|nr:hypothetical protein GCM10007963_20100 [Lutibacter litoralis]